jgi:hypothetical protein
MPGSSVASGTGYNLKVNSHGKSCCAKEYFETLDVSVAAVTTTYVSESEKKVASIKTL